MMFLIFIPSSDAANNKNTIQSGTKDSLQQGQDSQDLSRQRWWGMQ